MKLDRNNFLLRHGNHKRSQSPLDALTFTSHVVYEEDQILHVLVGLSPEYDSFVIYVTTRTEPSKFEDIAALLMTHETRLKQHLHSSVEINSLDINTTMSNPNITTHFGPGKRSSPNAMLRGNPQHTQYTHCVEGRRSNLSPQCGRGQSHGRNHENSNPQCHICYKIGHTIAKCFYMFTKNFKPQLTLPTINP